MVALGGMIFLTGFMGLAYGIAKIVSIISYKIVMKIKELD